MPQTSPLDTSPRSFQYRVRSWLIACFGKEIAKDTTERNHRFLEESLELAQACGCSKAEALELVEYVFSRPVGEPDLEAGGVLLTLAGLCEARGLVLTAVEEAELARVWLLVDKIRAKQQVKPKNSALPM